MDDAGRHAPSRSRISVQEAEDASRALRVQKELEDMELKMLMAGMESALSYMGPTRLRTSACCTCDHQCSRPGACAAAAAAHRLMSTAYWKHTSSE